jgi:hypothetical protein
MLFIGIKYAVRLCNVYIYLTSPGTPRAAPPGTSCRPPPCPKTSGKLSFCLTSTPFDTSWLASPDLRLNALFLLLLLHSRYIFCKQAEAKHLSPRRCSSRVSRTLGVRLENFIMTWKESEAYYREGGQGTAALTRRRIAPGLAVPSAQQQNASVVRRPHLILAGALLPLEDGRLELELLRYRPSVPSLVLHKVHQRGHKEACRVQGTATLSPAQDRSTPLALSQSVAPQPPLPTEHGRQHEKSRTWPWSFGTAYAPRFSLILMASSEGLRSNSS